MKLPTPGRSVEEWIARHKDEAIPERVRVRVFERYGGKCYRTGIRLTPGHWAIDHMKPLYAGGEHRESNLAPIWTKAHKEKSAEEATDRAKVSRLKAAHIGAKKRKFKWPKRKFGT